MTLEQILQNRHTITGRLPAFSATHQRYELKSAAGERLVLSFCDYATPVSAQALERQRRVGEALARPPLALLCRALESRFEPDYQFVISEFPGDVTLREVLQGRQSLGIEEVEAFLRLLGEACEAAVQAGWPRLSLDASHLHLDARLGLPRIATPDVPSFDTVGAGMPAFDPMQTMQFNAADLREGADPIPRDTREYVPLLAALCCDLLGQPQALRGGNARYQPVPQLTSQQNVMLRRALTGEGRTGSGTARNFMEEFFGMPMQADLSAHTESLRALTATITRSKVGAAALAASALTLRTPLPAARQKPAGPDTAPLMFHDEDIKAVALLKPVPRLRLVPLGEEAPIFALAADEWLLLGRSAADADFVAQFRPRSTLNDARSRRISRVQARAKILDGKIRLEEKDALNPSVHRDAPLGERADLDSPALVLLGGEFPLELHLTPSDYKAPRESKNGPWSDTGLPQGSLVARPGGPGVLLCEAVLVMSDVGIHFSQSGRPWFRVESAGTPSVRLHRLGGQFWLEALDEHSLRHGATDDPCAPHVPVLLVPGKRLRIGGYAYVVETSSQGPESEEK